jgi:hypothetical protein
VLEWDAANSRWKKLLRSGSEVKAPVYNKWTEDVGGKAILTVLAAKDGKLNVIAEECNPDATNY